MNIQDMNKRKIIQNFGLCKLGRLPPALRGLLEPTFYYAMCRPVIAMFFKGVENPISKYRI